MYSVDFDELSLASTALINKTQKKKKKTKTKLKALLVCYIFQIDGTTNRIDVSNIIIVDVNNCYQVHIIRPLTVFAISFQNSAFFKKKKKIPLLEVFE